MNDDIKLKFEEIDNYIKTTRIPLWEELPSFELYMDQVIGLLNRYLGILKYDENESEIITKNMINNYVKMKILPAPVKKKYAREHIAYLILVCMLKQVFSISMIKHILKFDDNEELSKIYNNFVGNIYEAAEFDIEKYSNLSANDLESCVIKLSAEAIVLKTIAEKVIVE